MLERTALVDVTNVTPEVSSQLGGGPTEETQKKEPVLRPYQRRIAKGVLKSILDDEEKNMEKRRTLVYLPTGGGKTVIAAKILQKYLRSMRKREERVKCLFVVNRCALIDQTACTFKRFGISFGFIKAGYPEDPNACVQIASIQSLFNGKSKGVLRIDTAAAADTTLLFVDEAHCILANQYEALLKSCASANVVGLTATPFRMKKEECLGKVFKRFVKGPSVSEMIQEGYLSPVLHFGPSTERACKLSAKMAGSDHVLSATVLRWRQRCPGKRTIVFCSTINQSLEIVQKFQEAGYFAAHIDGKTKDTERNRLFQDLDSNHLHVLSSVGVLSEGFDVKSIEAVILLRPTSSRGLYIQQIGRGLRISPGKSHCVVFDEVGNIYRHGPVDGPRGFRWEDLEEAQDEACSKSLRTSSNHVLKNLVKFCRTKRCDALLHQGVGKSLCLDCTARKRAQKMQQDATVDTLVADMANLLLSKA